MNITKVKTQKLSATTITLPKARPRACKAMIKLRHDCVLLSVFALQGWYIGRFPGAENILVQYWIYKV